MSQTFFKINNSCNLNYISKRECLILRYLNLTTDKVNSCGEMRKIKHGFIKEKNDVETVDSRYTVITHKRLKI